MLYQLDFIFKAVAFNEEFKLLVNGINNYVNDA